MLQSLSSAFTYLNMIELILCMTKRHYITLSPLVQTLHLFWLMRPRVRLRLGGAHKTLYTNRNDGGVTFGALTCATRVSKRSTI